MFSNTISLTIRVRPLVPIIVQAQSGRQTAPFSAEIHQKVALLPPSRSRRRNQGAKAAIRR